MPHCELLSSFSFIYFCGCCIISFHFLYLSVFVFHFNACYSCTSPFSFSFRMKGIKRMDAKQIYYIIVSSLSPRDHKTHPLFHIHRGLKPKYQFDHFLSPWAKEIWRKFPLDCLAAFHLNEQFKVLLIREYAARNPF